MTGVYPAAPPSVSRGLKIPCVIGTKVATKALKDGDQVEVDAEKGMVRVVKRG